MERYTPKQIKDIKKAKSLSADQKETHFGILADKMGKTPNAIRLKFYEVTNKKKSDNTKKHAPVTRTVTKTVTKKKRRSFFVPLEDVILDWKNGQVEVPY